MRAGAALVAIAGMLAAGPVAAETSTLAVQTSDGNRTVLVTDFGRGRPAPLVIVLHGALGPAEAARRSTTFDAVAEREGLVVVYPQALGRGWNDQRGEAVITQSGARADDVAFLKRLAGDLVQQGKADRRRIHIVGLSTGGQMAFRLACEAGDMLAGAAVILASLPQSLARDCRSVPVPMLLMHATEDPLMRWTGEPRRAAEAGVLSAVETLAFLKARNGCSSLIERPMADRAPEDGSRVVVAEGVGCRAALRAYRIEGGGHVAPGLGDQRLPPPRGISLGRQNRDIETAEEVWAFLGDKTR